MFARLRKKYGIREGKVSIKVEKTRSERMEEAKELLRTTDLSVPEIAKKLGLKEPAVYYHASKIRKKKQEQTAADEEIKDKPIQDKDNNDNFKEKYEKLEKEFKQIESKYISLMMDFNEYKKVYKNNSEAIQQLKNKNNSLEEKYEELLGKYRTLESDFWKVQKERNELQQKIKGFKENDTYISLLSKYNIEKAKHETLLKYLMLQVEENQGEK